MEDNTWLKLYRKLLKSPIFENEKALKIWIWCLLKATHIERDQLVGQQIVHLEKGQFVFGRNKAVDDLKNMSESTIYKYMKLLEKLQMISINSNNKFSIVTIEKWEDYQDKKQESNNKITTEEQQSNTNNNVNNIYLYLFNKYKAKIEGGSFGNKIKAINECKNEKQYMQLDLELQDKLFLDLQSLK